MPSATPPTVVPYLQAVGFANPLDGLGLFGDGADTCEDLIAPTSDGGASFGPLVAVPDACEVNSFAFDGQGDAFAYGPSLLVSWDGGQSWTPEPQPGAVLSIESVGASTWMVESGCPVWQLGIGSPCPIRLFSSSNGGRSWTVLPTPAGATVNGETPEGTPGQTYLVRASQRDAYLLSEPAPNDLGDPDGAALYATDDGGALWSPREVDCGTDALMVAMSEAPDGTLLAVCGLDPSTGEQVKSVVRSRDGGRTWAQEFVCQLDDPQQGCYSQPLIGGYLGAIDAVSSSRAFLVGARSALLETDDGGASWQLAQTGLGGSADGTFDLAFFGSEGVVLGDDETQSGTPTIWRTWDGGSSWSSVVPVAW